MISKDGDVEIARFLEMTEEELRAHVAPRGHHSEVAKEKGEAPPMEQLEKELFGASLDDIMNLSELVELVDLEIRPMGFVRQHQEATSAPLGPARSQRDIPAQTRHDDSTPGPADPSRASKKSS